MLETASEFFALLISSAGLSGTVIAIIFSYLLRKAKLEAQKKREERLQLEIQRLEGEEKLSQLLFTLVRYSRGICGECELDEAEKDYAEYIESSRKLKNRILGSYTAK